jgi:hypothetical protein
MAEEAAPTEEQYGYVADALYAELRRTWPEELTKQELLQASGFSTEEARAGLALLEQRGKLDTSGGQLKAVVDSEDAAASEAEEEKPADEEEQESPPAASDVPPPTHTPPVPGEGDSYRAHYAVMLAFGQNPGTSTDAVVKSAKAIEEEVADRLHKMYPGAIVGVELDAIDRDQPQRIYDKENPE